MGLRPGWSPLAVSFYFILHSLSFSLFFFPPPSPPLPPSFKLRDWKTTAKYASLLALWVTGYFYTSRAGWAPLYILGTIVLGIFTNLGKRREGEVSAWSVFNEDFRELPGTLNAEAFDQQIRHGNAM